MKDYTLDEADKANYIVDVRNYRNGTMDVIFADGSIYRNIECSEDNIAKIEDAEEAQVDYGLKNYKKYVKGKNKARNYTIAGSIAGFMIPTLASCLPEVSNMMSPVEVVATVGTITVLSTIPGAIKLVRENSKVKELNKLKYRNLNQDTLSKYGDYENSLEGVSNKTKSAIKKHDNPFSVMHVDTYTEDDLKQIVKNIKREDYYQFTYKKRPKKYEK